MVFHHSGSVIPLAGRLEDDEVQRMLLYWDHFKYAVQANSFSIRDFCLDESSDLDEASADPEVMKWMSDAGRAFRMSQGVQDPRLVTPLDFGVPLDFVRYGSTAGEEITLILNSSVDFSPQGFAYLLQASLRYSGIDKLVSFEWVYGPEKRCFQGAGGYVTQKVVRLKTTQEWIEADIESRNAWDKP